MKKTVKVEEKFGQTKLTENKSKFSLLFCRFPDKGKKVFIFYLTKTQIKKLNNMIKNKNWSHGILIDFSNNQLVKTYNEVIRINSKIYRKEDKTKPKQLAITYPISSNIENLDSLNFQ